MKKLFLLITATLVFTACSNDSQNTENTPQDEVLLQRTVETVGEEVSTRIYQYNGHKIVSETWESGSFAYEYTGDLITKIIFQVVGEPTPRYEQIFSYDVNSKLSQVVQLYYPNSTAIKWDFTHNADQTVSFDKYTGDFDTQNVFERSGKYFFNGNNEVSKIEEYVNDLTIKIEFAYDAHNAPFKNVTGYDKLFYLNTNKINNKVLTKLYNPHQNELGELEYEIVEIPSAFQYNEDNYPTDALITFPENSGSSVSSKTVQFFYE
ncbi:MAG TPA: hypothetical protein VLB74_12460 [Flavobacterium sp.]|uniref:hypothetical protein n=1 Tax=Flavobacterium sp. TaxID=239 RepID=UPI002BB70F36|nr:hypothetical protein [Flavobacterium sp.]HSD15455.1 hypothetical protein [Flavobacterium sp.]